MYCVNCGVHAEGKSVSELLREHLLSSCFPTQKPHIDNIAKSEWSEEFELLMRNRLIMGYLRYGPMRDGAAWDVQRIIDRIQLALDGYAETGNGEHLVDAANVCLVEFVRQSHPNYHFEAHDRDD